MTTGAWQSLRDRSVSGMTRRILQSLRTTTRRSLIQKSALWLRGAPMESGWDNFDPKRGGGQGGRDYFTEVNSWLYTFHVQHDVAGLIETMGGRERFNSKLDQLFVEQYGTSKYQYLD